MLSASFIEVHQSSVKSAQPRVEVGQSMVEGVGLDQRMWRLSERCHARAFKESRPEGLNTIHARSDTCNERRANFQMRFEPHTIFGRKSYALRNHMQLEKVHQ